MQTSLVYPESATPRSNTGSDSQPRLNYTGLECGIDELTLLWKGDTDILDITSKMLQISFDYSKSSSRKIGILWHRCYTGTMGALYSQRDTPDGTCHRLVITGTACQRASVSILHRYCQMVAFASDTVRCSRLDVRADDYGSLLQYGRILAALEEGQFSGFKKCSVIKNISEPGWTFSLGSRESNHYVRIYDKAAESGGRIDCRRFESEFKGSKSDQVFKLIVARDSLSSDFLGSVLLQKINFVDKNDKNLDRNLRLDWWDEFVSALSLKSVLAVVSKIKSSVQKKMDWIAYQVEKSLALIKKCLGLDDYTVWLQSRERAGTSRLREADDLMIVEYLYSQDCMV